MSAARYPACSWRSPTSTTTTRWSTWATRTPNGSFDITNVPAGSYQLTLWDEAQDFIIDSFNVTVGAGEVVDVGDKGLVGWFTEIEGSVFIDTNANGIKDPGEDGVRQFPLTLRERDNSLLDQGQNLTQTDANGHYSLKESYPLSRWMVLEAFNTGYKTTGITVQADNEKTPTTYVGAAVDLNVLPVIGLKGRVDWGVQRYSGPENGGIVGTVSYDTTRNETDPQYALSEDYQPGIPGIGVDLYAAKHDPSTGDVITDPVTGEVAGGDGRQRPHQAGGDLHLREVGPAHGVHGEDVGRHRADRPAGPAAGR